MPHLPLEVAELIVWCLVPVEPKDRDHLPDLISTSLISRVFHEASIKPLYQVLTPDTVYSDPVKSNLPRVLDTLHMHPRLGGTVRALSVHEEFYTPTYEDLLFSLVGACKENLEELSLSNFALTWIGDLLAQPRSLRLLRLHGGELQGPPTVLPFLPFNTVQHLALDYADFTTKSLPAQLFPSLRTLSFTNPDEDRLFDTLPFLISLPPTLTALRIHFDQLFLNNENENKGTAPTPGDWKQALGRLPNLEHLECNYFSITAIPNGGNTLFPALLHPSVALKTLKIFAKRDDARWEEELVDMWLSPDLPISCLRKVEAVKVVVEHDFLAEYDESDARQTLRDHCKERGITLEIEEVQVGYRGLKMPDPFFDELIPKKRWLNKHNSYFM